ncbi:hypothetical protein Bca101_031136 [Brassica carinata]
MIDAISGQLYKPQSKKLNPPTTTGSRKLSFKNSYHYSYQKPLAAPTGKFHLNLQKLPLFGSASELMRIIAKTGCSQICSNSLHRLI